MSLQLLAMVTAAGGLGLLALTYNVPAEYFMFSAVLAVIAVSYAASRMSARALSLTRELSSRVFDNEPMSVHLEIVNRGRLPRLLLDVEDSLPDYIEADGEHDFVVPSLWPGEQVSLSYTARARKRGVYTWRPLRVSTSDPFGFFPRWRPFDAPGEAVVYPRPIELYGGVSNAGMEARSDAAGERARGGESGLEFYGIRDYSPGDALRRIHWPATAHHGTLTVIEFDRGASDNIAVVLDASAGSEFGSGLDTSLEIGVRAAASLIHYALRGEGAGSLAVGFPGGPAWVSLDQEQREHEVLELLARVKADAPAPVSSLLSWAADCLTPDAAIVVITAAPDGALPAAVSALARRRLPVSVLLLQPQSFDPAAPDLSGVSDALKEAGATVVTFRRDENLREALTDVIALNR